MYYVNMILEQMYVCMYVCMYTLLMSGGPIGYWFDYVCMYVCMHLCTVYTFMVLIPITSPSRLTSGPPELPELIAASVCRYSDRLLDRPNSLAWRAVALTMPKLAVFCRFMGDPMAITNSPAQLIGS